MATRRSRISIRPNLGARPNRSNPASATSSPAAKPKPEEKSEAGSAVVEISKDAGNSDYLSPVQSDTTTAAGVLVKPPKDAGLNDEMDNGKGDMSEKTSGTTAKVVETGKSGDDGKKAMEVVQPLEKISAKEGLSNVPESPAPSSTRTPATKPAVKPMMRRPAMRFTPVTAKSRPRPAATTVAETVAEPVAEVSIKTSTATTEETAVEKSQEPQIEKPVQAVCSEPEVPENTYTMGSASRDVSGRALEKIEESQTEETKSSQADECVTPEWPVVQPFSIMKSPSRFSEGKSGLSLGTGLKSPPPGLARVRSRFAKTKPNLTPRARHSSMSGSEQEDDRRPASYLDDRTLSKTSITPQKAVKALSEEELDKGNQSAASEVGSEMRSPEHPSSGKQAGKSSDDEYRMDTHKTRKRRKTEMLYTPVDRTKLTLGDLIHMNPTSNPMTSAGDDDGLPGTNNNGEIILDDAPGSQPGSDAERGASDDDAVQVPQVTIGPDGQIVLNENSLVVEAPRDEHSNSVLEIINETGTCTNIGYGRRSQIRLWTPSETKKFYLALSAIGTDFSLMCAIFPKRSRTELKRKFKKEEKVNRALIDQAIRERHHFDQDFFEELTNLDVEAEEERKKSSRRTPKSRRKGGPRKTPAKRMPRKGLLYEESGEEENENDSGHDGEESQPGSPAAASDSAAGGSDEDMDVDGEDKPLKTIAKKTRSGRQPKQPKPFTQETINVPPRKKKRLMKADSPTVSKPASPVAALSPQSPGQFISLSNLTNLPKTDGNQIQAGSLVFVTTNPPSGAEQSDASGMIHVYVVAPDKNNAHAGIGKGVSLIGASNLTQLSKAVKVNPSESTKDDGSEPKTPEEASEIPEETPGEQKEDAEDDDLPVIKLGYEAGSLSSNEDDGPTLIIDPETGLVRIEGVGDTPTKELKKIPRLDDSPVTENDSCDQTSSSGKDLSESLSLPAPSTSVILTDLAHTSPTTAISTPAKIALTDNVIREIIEEDMP